MKNKLLEVSSDRLKGYKKQKRVNGNINVIEIKIDDDNSGFEKGRYFVINFDYNNIGQDYPIMIDEIKKCLKKLVKSAKKILVVGLGNKDVICDSLGTKTVSKLLLAADTVVQVMGLLPNVFGVTGIESYDIILGVIKQVKPDVVICIDTLSASNYDSLFGSVQISDTSITPGSGVGNSRKKLSKETLKLPVIVFGIPMLISLKNLVNSFSENSKNVDERGMWLAPKDIDFAVEEFSYIFAKSINEYFYPEFSSEEIEKYVKGIF